jgi:fructosamine-3-kinase
LNQSVVNLVRSIDETLLTLTPIAGGDICDAWRVTTDTGDYFAKTAREPTAGLFELEAAGLHWIAETGVATPEVIAATADGLLLEWLEESPPSSATAHEFGASLAQLHTTPADSFGCPPASASQSSGWIGILPMAFGDWGTWQQFYAEGRLLPTAELARERGRLNADASGAVERVCQGLLVGAIANSEPDRGPSRIHGDLWSGNVSWSRTGAALIDPAAHGGHPETDLAMLELFGVPFLRQIMTGYESVQPLERGRADRVSLHQLFPVLVHAALFGGSYGQQAGTLARRILRTW